MKKYIYMAVATIAALSSCDKNSDIICGGNDFTMDAPVFTATIEGNDATKTSLANGTKVNWVSNDEVRMIYANSDESSSFPVIYQATPGADATTATLSIKAGESLDPQGTKLLYAVYPASFIYDTDIQGWTIPATQMYEGDGKLTNIPMMYYNSPIDKTPIPSSLSFKNVNAVLAITVPYSELTSVKSITVSSNRTMNGAASYDPNKGDLMFTKYSTVTEENSKITLDCYTKAGQNVAIPNGGSKTFYIAIPPMNSNMSSFRQANAYGYLQIDVTNGIVTKTMKTKDGVSISVERNKIYPITFQTPAHAYVDLGLSVKWATMNVGATTPEGYGDYFAWGATEPLYEAGYAQESPQNHWKTDKSAGYCFNNTPYQTANTTSNGDTKWTKYIGYTSSSFKDPSATNADVEKKVLDLEDDAATVNWGGNWRVPTIGEWQELINSSNCTWTWTTLEGIKGYKVQSNKAGYTDNWIFLPAAGERDNTKLYNLGAWCQYWSSSLYTSSAYSAEAFKGNESDHQATIYYRCSGYPIRPVCE